MKFRQFALIFTILGLAVAGFAGSETKDETELKALINQLTAAQVAYDQATLDKILTADYIEISPLGEVDPRAKVLTFYAPEEKAKAANMTASISTDEYSIRIYKDTAVVITRFNSAITIDGKPIPPRSLRVTFVCKKEKNGWKIASAQYTGIRPQTPTS